MLSIAKKTYLSVGLVFICVIVLHATGALAYVEKVIHSSTIPLLGNLHGFSIQSGDDYEFFQNRSAFISAYQSCQASLANDAGTAATVALLTTENAELKQQLNFKQKSSTPSVAGEIVGKDISDTNETVIMNQGASSGIKIGDPVISGNGILVGEISQVEPDISFIRLLDDDQSKVGATILNQDGSIGVVEGGYGISLKMDLIPRDEAVLVGDQIVSSGLETNVPRGLLIGTVAVVENEPYKPFQQAILTSATDLSKLSLVSVLLTN